jgi:hypothetical protein
MVFVIKASQILIAAVDASMACFFGLNGQVNWNVKWQCVALENFSVEGDSNLDSIYKGLVTLKAAFLMSVLGIQLLLLTTYPFQLQR